MRTELSVEADQRESLLCRRFCCRREGVSHGCLVIGVVESTLNMMIQSFGHCIYRGDEG